jgi:hypothetical protein
MWEEMPPPGTAASALLFVSVRKYINVWLLIVILPLSFYDYNGNAITFVLLYHVILTSSAVREKFP